MSSSAFDRVQKASRREKSMRHMQFKRESLLQHYKHKSSRNFGFCTKQRNNNNNASQVEPLDNFSVMTRLYGSVWPRVSPLCLFNTVFCALIWTIDRRCENIDLSIDPSGHKCLASLLSFLVIARVRIMYNLSIKARENLSVINQNAHDLVETAAVLTHNNTSDEAMKWRRNVALRVIEFLIDCMDALSYNSDILDFFTPEEAKAWKRMSREDQKRKEEKQEIIKKQKFRKPTLSAMALKKAIYSHRYDLGSQSEPLKLEPLIAIPQAEMRLVAFVEASQDGKEFTQ